MILNNYVLFKNYILSILLQEQLVKPLSVSYNNYHIFIYSSLLYYSHWYTMFLNFSFISLPFLNERIPLVDH